MHFINSKSQTFESLDQVQHWILSLLLNYGEWVQPRGLNTLEISPITFTLLNPRKRCILNSRRKWSFPLAIGEFCWHISGSNELQFIQYYAKRWGKFSEDGSTIHGSCYGHKIFATQERQPSQWEQIIQLLKIDSQSRRAVLSFFDTGSGLDAGAKDIACACTLQFIIRYNKLYAISYMRSNDAIWGLPYDIFLFTMLQEMLACELGLALGTYTHFVGSIHVYEDYLELAQSIVESSADDFFEMPPMKEREKLADFLQLENQIREGHSVNLQEMFFLDKYWQDLLSVLKWYFLSRQAGGYSKVRDKIPDDFPYSTLLKNLAIESENLSITLPSSIKRKTIKR